MNFLKHCSNLFYFKVLCYQGISSLISPALLYALAMAETKDDVAFLNSEYFESWETINQMQQNSIGIIEGEPLMQHQQIS